MKPQLGPRALRVLGMVAATSVVAVSIHVADVRAQTSPGAAGGNASSGRTLYAKAGCDACHGPSGQGTAAAPGRVGRTLQLPAFVAYVRKPTGTMPPHGAEKVSDQGLADIFAFLRSAARALSVQADAPVPVGRADTGAMLYRKTGCYQCHANEGQGGLAGPRVGPDPVPFARFAQYLRQPTGDMPPYTEKVLSNQDMADIYAFLQARPRPLASKLIPLLAPPR
jgi:mono/diheme cytochrome c family protein